MTWHVCPPPTLSLKRKLCFSFWIFHLSSLWKFRVEWVLNLFHPFKSIVYLYLSRPHFTFLILVHTRHLLRHLSSWPSVSRAHSNHLDPPSQVHLALTSRGSRISLTSYTTILFFLMNLRTRYSTQATELKICDWVTKRSWILICSKLEETWALHFEAMAHARPFCLMFKCLLPWPQVTTYLCTIWLGWSLVYDHSYRDLSAQSLSDVRCRII